MPDNAGMAAATSNFGQKLWNVIANTLARVTGVPASTAARPPVLSQSSAPPPDLAYLWNQEGDQLSTYRDADLMDSESDLTTAALNVWASTATSGSLVSPDQGAEGEALGASLIYGQAVQAGCGLPSKTLAVEVCQQTDGITCPGEGVLLYTRNAPSWCVTSRRPAP